MLIESKATDTVAVSVVSVAEPMDHARAHGVFHFKCFDADGNLKWEADAPNLVVNVGLKDMNEKYFTGSAYTATWFLGLINASPTPTYAAADTASSHAGWVETASYSNATRPTCTFGTSTTADPSVISNTASPASFTMNGTVTVAGAFLISNSTKSGTTGTLFSEANFSSPGSRSVVSGDVIQVTYTFNLDAV